MKAKEVAFWLVAVLVGAAAIAFGAVETWAEVWLRFGAVAAGAAVLWTTGPRTIFRGAAGSVLLPAVLIVLWGLIQSLPLPESLLRVVSPRTARAKAETIPPGGGAQMPAFLLDRAASYGVSVPPGSGLPLGAADSGGRAVRTTLSVNPHATLRGCLAWLTPLLLGIVAERLARDRVSRYRLLWIVATWCGVLGAIAVAQAVTWNRKLLWFREAPPDSRPLGPFVNPNHFAGYVELGFFVVVGLMLAIAAGGDGRLSLTSVRTAILDRSWALPRLMALSTILALAIGGMALSGSRGAALAVAAGLVVLIPSARLRRWLPAAWLAVAAAALAAGLLSYMGPEQQTLKSAFFSTGVDDASLSMRLDIWGRTWRVLADYPVTGTGLGTFPWAYAAYDREGEWLGTIEAHNDILQLAAETGIVGIGLMIWWTAAFGRKVLVPALSASRRPPWTTVALAAACSAMLVHSALEFSLQIPAVAALFAVLAGMLCAASSPESGGTALEEASS